MPAVQCASNPRLHQRKLPFNPYQYEVQNFRALNIDAQGTSADALKISNNKTIISKICAAGENFSEKCLIFEDFQ